MKTRASRNAFTLVELLVVIAILAILIAVLLPTITKALATSKANSQMQQGAQVYKAIFGQVLEASTSDNAIFPEDNTALYANTTDYFKWCVTSGVVNADFSLFAGPGLIKHRTSDPIKFKEDGNAWNITVGLSLNDNASIPLLFSRNFLSDKTELLKEDEAMTIDMLGDKNATKKLDFDKFSVIVINKAGSGKVIQDAIFKRPGVKANEFNPTSENRKFIKPK